MSCIHMYIHTYSCLLESKRWCGSGAFSGPLRAAKTGLPTMMIIMILIVTLIKRLNMLIIVIMIITTATFIVLIRMLNNTFSLDPDAHSKDRPNMYVCIYTQLYMHLCIYIYIYIHIHIH